ncbi:MAG TPA: hypothetical protein VI299_01705 [Polyangiales bacterium]
MMRLFWWMNLSLGLLTTTSGAEDAPLCASDTPDGAAYSEGGDPSRPGCITFDEAADLAQRQDSGVYEVRTRGEPTASGLINASAEDKDAICRDGTCYVRGDGQVTLNAYGHQTVFLGWTGCVESAQPHLVLGKLTASTECVAHFGPGLISVHTKVVGRDDARVQISGSCSGARSCSFLNGGSVTLQAPPSDDRYTFAGWSGCSTAKDPTLVFQSVRQALPECVARYEPTPAN